MKKETLPDFWKNTDNYFPLFTTLHHEIDRVFDKFVSLKPEQQKDAGAFKGVSFQPVFDVSEANGSFTIDVELPGMDIEDFDISYKGETLVISGEKTTEKDETENDYHVVERSYGKFYRSIPLGFQVEPEEVKATYKNGVLTVTIPKPKELEDKSQKIEVSAA
ncbi:Hsp20/alpha crystallin family protein [Amylibacter sp. SFDW26]|uniref:Hsp20/alpha crystallin family protein n=1 Tax=Amylibacter sp. SFDW26 TaxID=2652722 RepID=UPI0012623A5C|nr:Hsp20/alpha crystallin family protein [Amylibacter sp. SFDW26]KAB7614436.1 Hsp20/alpha crystallin family protein [Amylibacter sp. SFDW26]